jgi:N-acetylglutamate synthase-like GNAT family acetyltransferase
MSDKITYRLGNVSDILEMGLTEGIAITPESLEFNVTGMGHQFWIAYEDRIIIALAVLSRLSPNEVKIIYLQVGDAYRGRGVGSSLLRTIMASSEDCDLTVIPFHGTEQFYRKLGFVEVNPLEMRLRHHCND